MFSKRASQTKPCHDKVVGEESEVGKQQLGRARNRVPQVDMSYQKWFENVNCCIYHT